MSFSSQNFEGGDSSETSTPVFGNCSLIGPTFSILSYIYITKDTKRFNTLHKISSCSLLLGAKTTRWE